MTDQSDGAAAQAAKQADYRARHEHNNLESVEPHNLDGSAPATDAPAIDTPTVEAPLTYQGVPIGPYKSDYGAVEGSGQQFNLKVQP